MAWEANDGHGRYGVSGEHLRRFAEIVAARALGITEADTFERLVSQMSNYPTDEQLRQLWNASARLERARCASACRQLQDSKDFPEGWGPVAEACASAIEAGS